MVRRVWVLWECQYWPAVWWWTCARASGEAWRPPGSHATCKWPQDTDRCTAGTHTPPRGRASRCGGVSAGSQLTSTEKDGSKKKGAISRAVDDDEAASVWSNDSYKAAKSSCNMMINHTCKYTLMIFYDSINIHPSIFYTDFHLALRVAGHLGPIPALC